MSRRFEPEFCVLFLRMVKGDDKCRGALLKSKEFGDLATEYRKYLC